MNMNATTSNANSNEQSFYNHTGHAVGFLSDFRLVSPNKAKGQKFKPFYAVRIQVLEGDCENPEKQPMSITLTSDEQIQFCQQHEIDINANAEFDAAGNLTKKGSAVFVAIEYASPRYKPFVYKGNRDGQYGVSISAKLMKFKYVSINSNIVLNTADKAESDSVETAVQEQPTATTSVTASEVTSVQEGATTQQVSLAPGSYSLDIKDPEFENKKAQLIAAGARWDRDNKVWVIAAPQVA